MLREDALASSKKKKKKSTYRMEFAIKAFLKMALCTQRPLYSFTREHRAVAQDDGSPRVSLESVPRNSPVSTGPVPSASALDWPGRTSGVLYHKLSLSSRNSAKVSAILSPAVRMPMQTGTRTTVEHLLRGSGTLLSFLY